MAYLPDRPWIEDEENPVYAQDDADAEKEEDDEDDEDFDDLDDDDDDDEDDLDDELEIGRAHV